MRIPPAKRVTNKEQDKQRYRQPDPKGESFYGFRGFVSFIDNEI